METKSYWRAARACGLTPQALSKSIRRFEEALGVRLFDRDTRSVMPTLVADEIATYARNIDAEATSLGRALDSLLGTGTNRLVIGTGAAAATKLVGEALLAVLEQRPKLTVNVVEGTYEGLIPQLMNSAAHERQARCRGLHHDYRFRTSSSSIAGCTWSTIGSRARSLPADFLPRRNQRDQVKSLYRSSSTSSYHVCM